MTFSVRRNAVAAICVSFGLLVSGLQVTAASAEDSPDPLEVMGEYRPSDYAEQAAALPEELVVAIDRDLGLSAEEYLAESDAAVQAGDVVNSLEDAGVPVLGSTIDGTDLTVYVPSEAEVPAIEAVGATAAVGEPEQEPAPEYPLSFATDIYGGQGYYWEKTTDNSGYQCSIGFNGYLVATGAQQLATAGHCTNNMNNIDGTVHALNFTEPGQPSSAGQIGASIGLPVAGTSQFGSGYDVGRIAASGSGIAGKPSVVTWGGGSGAPLSSAPLAITRSADPTVGANLCRSGSRTGWRCGEITSIKTENVGGKLVHSIVAAVCVLPGDSGGSAMIGSAAVGITSWRAAAEGDAEPTCATTPYSGFFPIQGSGETLTSAYGATWELAVTVPKPAVSFSGTGALTTTISGTLANASASSKVNVYFDGSSTPTTVSASSGTWSASISSLGAGIHTFSVEGTYGAWSKGPALTGYFTKGMTTARLSGADRYDTSAAVAAKFTSADTVYLASGVNYPDALSAAPAAVYLGGPLLLTTPTDLPTSIASQLSRLDPTRVILVGDTSSISSSVRSQVAALLPGATIVRQAGADRYATSLQIAGETFPESATNVAYVATGTNFPDALSAAAAAGDRSAPIILVYGQATSIDTATRDLIADLGISQVYVAGSAASVSNGISSSIDSMPGVSVQRLSGPDRFQTSVAINSNAFPTATQAYLAVGSGFADALSGAALAGRDSAPLFVVPGNCVPLATLDALDSMGVTKVTLLGSVASLDANVAALNSCG